MSSYIWNSAHILRASVHIGTGLCNAPFMYYMTYRDTNLGTNLFSTIIELSTVGNIMEMSLSMQIKSTKYVM